MSINRLEINLINVILILLLGYVYELEIGGKDILNVITIKSHVIVVIDSHVLHIIISLRLLQEILLVLKLLKTIYQNLVFLFNLYKLL
jgi:hypothetical protein